MSHRTWIKVYVDKWLEGTISEESISVRGTWISLLALAGNGKYGDNGTIMAIDRVGFNDKQLSSILKISIKMWLVAKKRLQITDRILITNNNVISIINWQKYQSEYERTAKYRTNATTNATPIDTTNDTPIEGRGERGDSRTINKLIVGDNNSITTDTKGITTDKKDKKEKKGIYGQFQNVYFTVNEYQKLNEKLNSRLPKLLEALSEYKAAHGKKYDSDYAALLGFDRRDREKEAKENPIKKRRILE